MKRKIEIIAEEETYTTFGHKVKYTGQYRNIVSPEEAATIAVEEMIEDGIITGDSIEHVKVIDEYEGGRKEELKII
jgi:hypothetical protein